MTSPLALARQAIIALTVLNAVGSRTPTAAEAAELALWPGWGPLAPALTPQATGGWAAIAEELETLVPAAHLTAAAGIVDTSFYTSPAVVTAVFDLLRATGFTAGRILEPGCGSGNLMSGTPADLAVEWTGVEIDPTAARFARTLNPDATIIGQPLEKTSFRTGSFDAVIGNVPFSSATVFDPAYESGSLHEYFTLRALDAVRPGCYVIIVTSRHMIDGANGLTRIRQTADLISAVRLPTGTFDGTDVVADILVLRKRADGDAVAGWTQPTEEYSSYSTYGRVATRPAELVVSTGEYEARVNGLWAEHLDCVAGTLTATSFFKSPLSVLADDPAAAIRQASVAAAAHIDAGSAVSADHDPFTGIILEDIDGRKTGSFHVVDGLVFQIVNGTPVPATSQGPELRALIALRDAATELIALESHPDRPDHQIEPARVIARDLYTGYVKVFGPLNRGNLIVGKPDPETGEPALSWRRPLMGGFRRDPDNVSVMALEQFDQETGEARPAPILLRRVGAHPPRATSAGSAEEALAISLGEGSGVDLGRIGELIGMDEAAVLAELGDLVFRDPEARGALTIARDYLSGDVRARHTAAKLASETDPEYWRNVEALEAVLPALLGPLDIRVQLGATWIAAADVQEFTREVFGRSVRIEFTAALALWEVDAKSAYAEPGARIEFGTTRMSPYDLVNCALNGKAPIVTDEVFKPATNSWGKVKNQSETLAAEEKLRAVQERFSIWVWEDEARAARLLAEYNRRFNSHVIRRGDGSYLTFPGMDDARALWPWQRDAVDRIISTNKVLIGHPVGSGKTLSMLAGVMTLRRMGLARKPLIAVPNHLLEQIAREAQQAYPTGRFLIASKDDLSAENRRLFAARCATGEWDAVVITHQAFTSIGVDADTESEWLEEQKSDLRAHMQSDSGGGRRGAKAVATALRKLEERISALRYGVRDENQITFEQLGVDHISVDECFPFETLVQTNRGPLPIGQIVEDGLKVLVASVDKKTGKTEYKPIRRWVKKATNESLVRIIHETGSFTCTPNHPIWIEGRGYVRADSIAAGEALRTLPDDVRAEFETQPVLFGLVQDMGIRGEEGGNAGVRSVPIEVRAGENDASILQLRLPRGIADAKGDDLRGVRIDVPADILPTEVLRSGLQLSMAREAAAGAASGHPLRSVLEGVHSGEQEGDVLLGDMFDSRAGAEVRTANLRVVLDEVRADAPAAEILRGVMLEQSEPERVSRSSTRQAHAGRVTEPDDGRSCARADEGEQSHERPECGRQDEGFAFPATADVVASEWRERDDNGTAATAGATAGPADGILYSDPSSLGFVRVSSEFLLSGSGVRGGEAGDRGGREQPQDEEVAVLGSPENGGLGSSRVVSVEVLERGGLERHGEGRVGDPRGDVFVYNLEVADNHNYFAGGVLVSNCHLFRRLQISTRAEGFSMGSSKRATDLLLKVDTLGQRYPGKPVAAFFTGTPWSNTLAETYVWQRFLQPERLISAGVEHFDAWAATFVRYESKVEVTPDGQGFRLYRRPSVIQNVPELRLMLGAVADLLTAESIGLERPQAVWTNVVSEPGDEQREFVENLAVRADAIRTPGTKPQRPGGGDDNMLVVCNDGRLAALDPRLVGLDEDSTKVEDAAQRIAGHYHAGKNRVYGSSPTPGSFQLVLCDIGTPRPGDTQVYGRLRTRLVELGLPAQRVRFVHEAKTDKARDHQFAEARDGKLSVLIGSTSKVGVGTNIQTRLEAVHHLDAPWRPSDIEQREGRALRPGNLNELVSIYRYVTRKSFDSFMWQTLERKQRFISQMFVADGTIRELEDIGDAVLNFAEVKAIAAGNPELLRQAELSADVRRLRTIRAVWGQTVNRLRSEAKENRRDADSLKYRAATARKVLAFVDGKEASAPQSFTALANLVKSGTGWGGADYRGLDIRLVQQAWGREGADRVVEIRHSYVGVGEITVSKSIGRKSVADLAAYLHERVELWLDALTTDVPRLDKAVEHRLIAAIDTETAADLSVFGQELELLDAERSLARVEAKIAESVEDKLALVAA